MSCNGCRVLRKGCSENCILRPCLQWIESPESQGHATIFVAKFFGRAGLMSFISAVPEPQRPALFQSLLYEAAGRTVNPVNGAVGLLWTGNWNVCQAAVETVLRGGTLRAMPDLLTNPATPTSDESSEVACTDIMWSLNQSHRSRFSTSRSRASPKRKRTETDSPPKELDLRLSPSEEESVTTAITTTTTNNNNYFSFFEGYNNRLGDPYGSGEEKKLLDLFT